MVDAPPSPPPEGEGSSPTAYYRPSREAILTILKAKVDRLAAAETFGKFDHLVRALGREGLLDAGADPALVQGQPYMLAEAEPSRAHVSRDRARRAVSPTYPHPSPHSVLRVSRLSGAS